MNTGIRRDYFWTDKTMDELLESELFAELHNVFRQMEKEPMMFPMDEEKVLNEVGYRVTWLGVMYCMGEKDIIDQFVREVYARMGIREHAEAVMSLVHAVVAVQKFSSLHVGQSVERALKKLNGESWCGQLTERFIRRINREGVFFDDVFVPHLSAAEFDIEDDESGLVAREAPAMPMMVAEAPAEYNHRTFTFDEIVKYIEENASMEQAPLFQIMLYNLLVDDGTREELKTVNAILVHIRERERNSIVMPNTAVSFAGDLVLKKETTIDKNYGPNIEQNGGTLSLPDSPSGSQ